MEFLKNGTISYIRFEEYKNKMKNTVGNQNLKSISIEFSKLLKFVEIHSPEHFRLRKQLFMVTVAIDIRDIIKNQVESRHKYKEMSIAQISKILDITQK